MMRCRRELALRRAQRGMALLVGLLVLVLGAGALLLTTRSTQALAWRQTQHDRQVLVRARELLIARALATVDASPGAGSLQENRPGALRCVDADADGDADGAGCGGRILGRFPWHTLMAEELRDHSLEPLWYAVAPELADHGNLATVTVNSEAAYLQTPPALLQLDGEWVAALLIAPGPALPGQAGRGPRSMQAGAYLEAANADGDGVFVSTGAAPFNDRLLAVRVEDYMPAVERLVLEEVERALLAYHARPGCASLPWAAGFDPPGGNLHSLVGRYEGLLPAGSAQPLGGGGGCPSSLDLAPWVRQNHWPLLIYYAVAEQLEACQPGSTSNPCLSLRDPHGGVRDDVAALLVLAGAPLAQGALEQVRRSDQPGDYFEGENSDGGPLFESRPPGAAFNDQLRVVRLP